MTDTLQPPNRHLWRPHRAHSQDRGRGRARMYAALSRSAAPRGGVTDRGLAVGAVRESPRNGAAARSAAPDRSGGDFMREPPQTAREAGNGHTAADLDRSARATFDEMRAVLKNQPPWSREVETFRQKTRNYHQTLIFNHPLHPLSQNLDQLWVRTSYTLIASFREHVARAETALQAQSGGAGSSRRRPRNDPADQDLRKVLTRFRQALASEEGFYRQFILRLIRFFGMEEICKDTLIGVGLSVSGTGEEGDEGRKWSNEEKKEKVGLVYKALVCLGDVERYKEQYSDGYRREKAGGSVSKGKGEEGERFSRARAYYDAARSLVPEDGSAYNQLAVIATYLNDDFATVYNYFRALAIKVPFKGINEILDRYLRKAFERWSEVENKPTKGDEMEMDEWKKEVVVLVAILYRQNGFSNLPTLKASILPTFSTFLLSRRLPSESIVRLTTITIGLHWHTRSLSSILPLPSPGTATPKSSARIQQAEDSALDFLLCVFIVLLTVSAAEIEEIMRSGEWTNPTDSAIADDTDTDRELYTSISAVLRRVLPSLRLVSKWLKLHLDYLSRYPAPPNSALETSIPTFWSAYYRLIEALARCFPLGMLPGLESGLEEDEDMRGFMPISRGLIRSNMGGTGEGDVHPNEEQLMRIADLQVDATLILQAQTSGTNALPDSAYLAANDKMEGGQTREEDQGSVNTETEDDPVNMAMRVSLGGEDRDIYADEPVHSEKWQSPGNWDINFRSTPVANQFPPTSHPHTASATPAAPPFAPPAQNTAFDLLNNLVSPPPPLAQPSRNTTSGPASPGLLFGFGGEGIWSMTREESTSQKGLERDSFSQLDQMGTLSRGGSDRARQRGEIGAGGVKALWDTPVSATGAGSPLGAFGGTAATPPRIGQIGGRRISNGTTLPHPMDAAQLFAGISGLGLGAPSPVPPGPAGSTVWSQPNLVGSGGNHGVIGRPSQSQLHQPQVPPYSQMYGSGSNGGFNGYPAWG